MHVVLADDIFTHCCHSASRPLTFVCVLLLVLRKLFDSDLFVPNVLFSLVIEVGLGDREVSAFLKV